MSELGKARRVYEAELRSGWDSYPGAIEAARRGNVSRLVDCLRARKPLTDCVSFVDFIAMKLPWRAPERKWLAAALHSQSEADYDALADFADKVGLRRGRQNNAPVHSAARLAEVLLGLIGTRISATVRKAVIGYACNVVSKEVGAPVSAGQVCSLLDQRRQRRKI
jgi:hypothetical protein